MRYLLTLLIVISLLFLVGCASVKKTITISYTSPMIYCQEYGSSSINLSIVEK